MSTTLQDRIRLLAEAAGSLRRVDAAAQLRFGHTHAIAEGRIASPTLETLQQLSDACGVTFDWLAFGKGDPPDPAAVRAAVDAARSAQSEVAA